MPIQKTVQRGSCKKNKTDLYGRVEKNNRRVGGIKCVGGNQGKEIIIAYCLISRGERSMTGMAAQRRSVFFRDLPDSHVR